MTEINWSKSAIADLKNIQDYIKLDSIKHSILIIDKIFKRTEQLLKFPLSGRRVPEFFELNIREIIEGRYRIFYMIKDEKIIILRIHHSSKLI